MSRVSIEKTCPACKGTGGAGGKTSIGLSEMVSGSGFCSVCKGKGKITEWVNVPNAPVAPRARSSTSSSGEDSAVGCVITLALMTLVIGVVLIYALLKALIRQLSTAEGRLDISKFLGLISLCAIVYIFGGYALAPQQFRYMLPNLSPAWQYGLGIAVLLPIGILIWGLVRNDWLMASVRTLWAIVQTFFEGIGDGWNFVARMF